MSPPPPVRVQRAQERISFYFLFLLTEIQKPARELRSPAPAAGQGLQGPLPAWPALAPRGPLAARLAVASWLFVGIKENLPVTRELPELLRGERSGRRAGAGRAGCGARRARPLPGGGTGIGHGAAGALGAPGLGAAGPRLGAAGRRAPPAAPRPAGRPPEGTGGAGEPRDSGTPGSPPRAGSEPGQGQRADRRARAVLKLPSAKGRNGTARSLAVTRRGQSPARPGPAALGGAGARSCRAEPAEPCARPRGPPWTHNGSLGKTKPEIKRKRGASGNVACKLNAKWQPASYSRAGELCVFPLAHSVSPADRSPWPCWGTCREPAGRAAGALVFCPLRGEPCWERDLHL